MRLSDNTRKKLLLGCSGLLFLSLLGFLMVDRLDLGLDLLNPPPPPPVGRIVPKPAPVKRQEPTVTETVPPALPVDAGAVYRLANKQALLDEKKLDVTLAKLDAELDELHNPRPKTPVAPAMMLPPLAAQTTPEPNLEVMLKTMEAQKQPPVRPQKRGLYVESIRGLNGNLSAVVASPQGKKTVRTGDMLDGKIVDNITLDSVSLRSGKTHTQLPIED